jgi:hypothetical protein
MTAKAKHVPKRTWMENYPLHIVRAIAANERGDTPRASQRVASRELERRGQPLDVQETLFDA